MKIARTWLIHGVVKVLESLGILNFGRAMEFNIRLVLELKLDLHLNLKVVVDKMWYLKTQTTMDINTNCYYFRVTEGNRVMMPFL